MNGKGGIYKAKIALGTVCLPTMTGWQAGFPTLKHLD